MIRLTNSYCFDFACASGSLGFDGRGWWWEKPLRWLGYIDPNKMLVITKTLTMNPRKGNLRMYAPWRCVRLVSGGAVNAVGLTNPGIDRGRWLASRSPYCVAVSIAPETPQEAAEMSWMIRSVNHWMNIVGIEVNVSCPNTGDVSSEVSHVAKIVRAATSAALPVMVKLGWTQPFLDICRELDGEVAAFDLINTMPWKTLCPTVPSPLANYGLEGGVSGELLRSFALAALFHVKDAGIRTPVLSGGGVLSLDDVRQRFDRGADAVAFGTLFLRRPWMPNKIICQWKEDREKRPSGAESRPA